MKVALVFAGIAYGSGRDYRHCLPNIQSNIIEPLKRQHELEIHLTSYENECTSANLAQDFQPQTCTLLPQQGSHQVRTYLEALKPLANRDDLDVIVTTRFDIHFFNGIDTFGLDFTKFNALFREKGWWESMRFTTDNFYAFPYEALEAVRCAAESLLADPPRPKLMDMHQLFFLVQQLVGEDRTHLVSGRDDNSQVPNDFYALCRKK